MSDADLDSALTVAVDSIPGGLQLTVVGELDVATSVILSERIGRVRAQGLPTLIDVDGLTFVDSAGVRLLLANARAAFRGAPVTVTRGSTRLNRLVGVMGLDRLFPYTPLPASATEPDASPTP